MTARSEQGIGKSVQMRVNSEVELRLQELSAELGISRSAVVSMAVTKLWREEIGNRA